MLAVAVMCKLYLVWTALGVPQGQIRLLLHPVQVFMKAVQQEGQQLLGVLLLVAGELRRKASNLCLVDVEDNINLSDMDNMLSWPTVRIFHLAITINSWG